ncbi:hypothetical protein O7634_08420 [Micromonospora sp. WMMD1120]|uniref:hypothetical protein n=1 Tax=Micromonospora sp. WMMD1120 TaxID=3016106 RepID=UPI00241683DA|nr:hypothetical protein [Micromonospora sp. WMMD1120]MDG4806776.1 hypothetical protein [Micromonospora sp. WMMD1120]
MSEHETITGALRRAAGARNRRVLLLVTVVVGVVAATALVAGLPPAERTVVAFAEPVHAFISVPLPFIGVMLAHDLRKAPGAPVLPTLAAATLIAVAAGVAGDAILGVALAASGSTAPDRWTYAGPIALTGVLVQLLAQLVGTGLGLLIARPLWACLATVVLPLGAYALLTPLGAVRDALTPYGALQQVLTEAPTGTGWVRWATAAVVWGVALNVVGAVVRCRTDRTSARTGL